MSKIHANESVDLAMLEMKENHLKKEEIANMNTKKDKTVRDNILGIERFGKDFSLKITRSLSPTHFRKKSQQITRSSLSSSGSPPASSSTPPKARHPAFLKPMDLLFGSESSFSCDQSTPGNMMFLGQMYREDEISK